MLRYNRNGLRPLLAIAFLAVFATGARAQEPPSPTPSDPAPAVAEARELYARGLAAIEESRWADALGLFERSYALSAAAPALFNQALVLRALGRIRDARDALARLIGRHPDADEAIRMVADLMHAEAAARVAQISLVGLPRDPGLRLRFDGAPLAVAPERPMRLEVDPGPHTLAVILPDHELFEWRGWIRDGAQESLRIELVEESAPVWPWLVAGGIALVAAVVVGWVLVTAEDQQDTFAIEPPALAE